MDRDRSAAAGGRTRFLSRLVAVSALAALVVVAAEPVLAKRMVGTNGADRIVGTKKPDRIKARGGNDRVKGSRGKDRIKGAGGKDRLSAGRGADRLNAVDGKKDRSVNGGSGKDVCKVDQADLGRMSHCEKAKVKNGGQGGGGLQVTSASGLTCGNSLPLCQFQIEGEGADATTGTVSGGGGVDPVAGAAVSTSGENWTAAGLYGCTADGYLKVTIGSKFARVPVTCTT